MTGSGHLAQYLWLLVQGAGVTLQLSLAALLLGSLAGLLLGLARSSLQRVLWLPSLFYIEAIRSTPFLVLLFFIYYGMPLVLGIDIPAYPSALAALSLYCSAYMAEVVRAGIEAVPTAQREAATALGLRRGQAFRRIVLPQALPIIVPPAIGVCISTVKESALASTIGFVDLLGTGLAIRDALVGSGGADVLVWVGAMYVLLCYALSVLGDALRRRWGSLEIAAPGSAKARREQWSLNPG